MLQLLRFGCSYQAIADPTCSATTIRNRRDEWIWLGIFAKLKQITLESYDRIVGLVLDEIAVNGSITKAPAPERSQGGHRPITGKGVKRSGMTDGYGIPLRVPAGANRHGSPRPWTAWDRCPTTSPGTWTPATTRTRPAPCSTNAACTAASHIRARSHPSRQSRGGMSNGPTLGRTPSTGSPAATNAGPLSSTPSSTSPTRFNGQVTADRVPLARRKCPVMGAQMAAHHGHGDGAPRCRGGR